MSRIIKSRTSVNENRVGKVIGIKDISQFDPNGEIELDGQLEIEKKKILEHFQHQAKEILLAAEQNAEEIRKSVEIERNEWIEEKARLVEEAKSEGYQHGFSEGQKQGFDQYKHLIETANQITDEMRQEFLRHIESSEKVILDLGIKAAEKILQETLMEHPSSFVSLVKQVVKEARENKDVHIYIHPNQFSLVIQSKEELDALFLNNQQCYLYPDDQLNEYQCLIETSHGRIDASIDSQLSELKLKLMEIIEGVHS
ncbi:flagellar assembly protein FliH [Heyndrickxia vini]|uniref:Flagellar assembly protein FliH n=1 Tax=Heyndrickxia vini TaxID=1476025 RepID=A0ABX7DYB6_9BACI|nr:flagellar assembly protein FliH [Heyndrickxia vini]QQZ07949.1 flagellar assembly protein FliH [Heyndrickxia vini]